MSGANAIVRFANWDRDNSFVDIKTRSIEYKTPDYYSVPIADPSGGLNFLNAPSSVLFKNILFPNGSNVYQLVDFFPVDMFTELSKRFLNNLNSEWSIQVTNDNSHTSYLNFNNGGVTPNFVQLDPNTVSTVTFRLLTQNPPTFSVRKVLQGTATSGIPLPSPAVLGDVLYYNGTNWVAYPGVNWLNLAWSPAATELNDPPVYWQGTIFKANVVTWTDFLFGPTDPPNWSITETARNGGALNELANIVTEFNDTLAPLPGAISLQNTADFYWELDFDVHFSVQQNWTTFFYNFTLTDTDTFLDIALIKPYEAAIEVAFGVNLISKDYRVVTRLPNNVSHIALNFVTLTGSPHGNWTPCNVTINLVISKRRLLH